MTAIIISVIAITALLVLGKMLLPLVLLLLPLLQRLHFIALNGFKAYQFWQQYQQKKPNSSTHVPMTRQQAMDILALREPFTNDEVEAAFRRLSKRVHPDVGGTAYFMRLIDEARQTLLREK